ncbi:Bax inhibitor-1/YccA family protein [bacterium]|nr:MAG: Bax inhibitor-1/YccA family protein [bacterium]
MYGTINGSVPAIDEKVWVQVRTRFITNVYGWMAGGLGVSAAAALLVLKSDYLMTTFIMNGAWFTGLIIAQLGLVMGLSWAIGRISTATASWLFVLYSALSGMTMSVVLLRYTSASVLQTLAVSSAVFGGAALYGTFTKKDLTSWGSFLLMGLLGLVIATVVNIFTALAWLDWALTYLGVFIFTGLAAYDSQKIQRIGLEASAYGDDSLSRASIYGALALYLDFVNLFLFMLRLTGRSRD